MKRIKHFIAICVAAGLLVQGPGSGRAEELPDFGTPADSVLSKSREAQLGRSVMLQLRKAGAVVEDPQLTEYLHVLGSSLASQASRVLA